MPQAGAELEGWTGARRLERSRAQSAEIVEGGGEVLMKLIQNLSLKSCSKVTIFSSDMTSSYQLFQSV